MARCAGIAQMMRLTLRFLPLAGPDVPNGFALRAPSRLLS